MDPNAPLAYYDVGSGDSVIVLLHGFCESKDLWKGFDESLLLHHRVITPDLPGFGDSFFEEPNPTIEYFADKVYQLLTFLQVPPCIMIGHSLGGYVTLAFAERFPDMLKGFGLFNSTAFADNDQKKENRNRTIEFIEAHGMDVFADSFVSPLFYHKNRISLQAEINMMKDICRKCNKDAVIATTRAMRDRKERIDLLKRTALPVLFIIGKEDGAVPLEKSLEQCYLPERHVVHLLEETAHMGMFEQKEETIRMVKEFVEGI